MAFAPASVEQQPAQPPMSRETLKVSGDEAFARRGQPPVSHETLKISGEEAFARRAQLSVSLY